MPISLEHCENRAARRNWRVAAGEAYQRTYEVEPGDLDALPEEGDAMPGIDASLLGPFIAKDGIEFAPELKGGKQVVTLTAIKLKARGS